MSELESRKTGRVRATATVAAVVALAAGAGGVLWLRGGMRPIASVSDPAPTKASGPCGGKPAKLYRNPMGTPDTSPVAKKDSMGMDYIPVCEDDGASEGGNVVKVSLDRVQRLGVRSEAVEERALLRTVRAFAP